MSSADSNVKQPSSLSAFNDKGEFVRRPSTFRNWISADGSTGFKAEAGRYHLYVSLACTWSHRTLILRKLKGLEHVISTTVVDPVVGEGGWTFTYSKPKCSLDTVNNCKFLKEVYLKVDPQFDRSGNVPCLWDKQTNTIVNNESSEILRMLNAEFNAFCETKEQSALDFYPESLRDKIDAVNEWVYPQINNGVYRTGLARTQEAYNTAVTDLFRGLDKVEEILSKSRYLVSNTHFTEADIRLFTTIVRFDMVYHTHYKANKRRIVDYPNMWAFVREVYQMPGVADTVDMQHILEHYYGQQRINPLGIAAIGPDLDFMQPHGRERM